MAKENDLFLNQLENVQFNAFDFSKVGLDATNTSLESKDEYKKLDYIKNHPYFQTNGAFDEAKFNGFYDYVTNTYNQMANNELGDLIGSHASFYRNNIYAPESQRRRGYDIQMYRTPNPLKQSTGFGASVDSVIENPLSLREIAQTQKVWDTRSGKWIDSPNEAGIFKNFGRTLVLAQWDEDGTHEDPVTGEMVEHKKGDKKLNSEGTYYYETLGNRSIYGRDVLSKWDTITTDGSVANKFDPFDADDKDPNMLGVIIRNALKIAPAFIPVISPYYLGLRVALNTADLMATAGNIITDNHNTLFNGIEGYAKSLGYSSSDFSQEHAWSLENMLNMGADVFTQLAEQRWIFKYPPALFKGSQGMSVENQEKLFSKYLTESRERTSKEIKKLLENGEYIDFKSIGADAQMINQLYASQQVAKYMDDYLKLGRMLSMGYMTGITVKDSYGEAKQEGATGIEAALLTLGYAVAEYKLINSDLGRWILPELRAENNRWRQIAKTLSSKGLDEKTNLMTQDKGKILDWAKKVMHIGKTRALEDYSDKINKRGVFALAGKAMIANALGEGVEETSEELLYDASKSIYNLLHIIGGSDGRLTAFDNVLDRYTLSFVGGVIGGGLGQVTTEYRQAAALQNIDKEKAFDELVQIVKEGKADEFLKVIDKTTWASTRLSTIPADIQYDMHGNAKKTNPDEIIFKPADDVNKSQDAVVKEGIHKLVNLVDGILNVEGAKVSDSSLLKKITSIDDPLKEFRAVTLGKSVFARDFITDYNTLVKNLVNKQMALNGHYQKLADAKDSEKLKLIDDPSFALEEAKLKQEVHELEKELQDYFDDNSEKVKELSKKVLFEMSAPIVGAFENSKLTLASYLENTYGKPVDLLTEEEAKLGIEDFKQLYASQGRDALNKLYEVFSIVNVKASNVITQFALTYFDPNSIVGKFKEFVHREEVRTQQADEDAALKSYEMKYGSMQGLISTFLAALAKLNKISISYEELVNMLNDPNLDKGENFKRALTVLIDFLKTDINNGKTLLNEIKNNPYITAAVKKDLTNIFNTIELQFNQIEDDYSDEMVYMDNDVHDYLMELSKAVNETNYSPITEFLDKFSIAAKGKQESLRISKLIEDLDDLFRNAGRKKTLKELSYNSDETEEQINNALAVIDLAFATVQAARTDRAAMGDLFGFNKSSNQLDPDVKLAEIDSNVADTITLELSQIKDRLTYYKTLVDINAGNRLARNTKTSIKGQTLFFDKIITRFNLPNYPPGEESSAEELKSVLNDENNFKILRGLQQNLKNKSNNWSVAKELEEAYLNEIKKLQDALHTFFSKNQDLINDPEKLSELLNPAYTGIVKTDKDILNINAEQISDSAFVWYLASLASMDPSKYMSLYQTSLKDMDLIPVIGQESAVMIAYSAILNGKVFENFAKAYNIALAKYAESSEGETWAKETKEDLKHLAIDSKHSLNFLHTVLVEGIAGSGKSNGVAKALVKLIKLNPKTQHLLDNVWFVHTTEDKAKALSEKLGISNAKVFSHESLMRKISGTNPDTGRTWNEVIDSNGNLQINTDDLVYDGEHPVHYNFPLNAVDKPTLIITDEVSHMSVPSLYMVDEFVNLSGAIHLTFGDFHQSGVTHHLENVLIKKPDGSTITLKQYYGLAYNSNFIHTPKLGESLRSDNRLKDYNNALFELNIESYFTLSTISKSILRYFDDPEYGLIGDKTLEVVSGPEQEKWFLDFENYVRHLLDITISLGEKEKLGYIFDTKDAETGIKSISTRITEIMRNLSKEDKYKDRIDFREGNSAQGDEWAFYVTNLGREVHEGNKEAFIKDLYTGITRAQRGNLIINYSKSTGIYIGPSIEDSTGKDSPLTDEVKNKYISGKQSTYEKVYGDFDPESLPYIPYTTPTTTDNRPAGLLAIPEGTILTDGNNNYKLVKYEGDNAILENVDDPSDTKTIPISELSKWSRATDTTVEETKELNSVNLNKEDLIDNSDPTKPVEMMHHSYNAHEYGLILNPDRNSYSFGTWNNVRLDNVIGLAKLIGIDTSKDISVEDGESLINTLNIIRSAARKAKSEADILKVIEQLLNALTNFSTKGMSIRFFYKVSQRPELWKPEAAKNVTSPSDIEYKDLLKGKYYKPSNESVPRYVNDSETYQHMNDATISMMLIDENGTELFETSLFTDTNPVTLAFSESFGEITEWITQKREELKNKNALSFNNLLEALKNELTNGTLKGHKLAPKLLNQIALFEASHDLPMGGQIQLLRNANGDWLVPGRDWESTGLVLRTDESNTIANEDEFVEYAGESVSYKTLEDSGLFILSDDAYIAPQDIQITLNGRTLTIKAGKAFIIATDNLHDYYALTNNKDNVLWKDLIGNKDNNDISIIYIEPPTKSFFEYLQHVNNVYTGVNQEKSPYQSALSFRIVEELFKHEDFIKERLKNISESDADAMFEQLSNLVKTFSEILVNNSGRENELILELSKLADLDSLSSFSGFLRFSKTRTKYVNVFDLLVRLFALGLYSSDELRFEFAEPDSNSKHIKEITLLLGDKFKYEFFTRINYLEQGSGDHVGNGANKIIKAKLTKDLIKIRGTLLTSALITKGAEAKAYEESKTKARTSGRLSTEDSKMYESKTPGSFGLVINKPQVKRDFLKEFLDSTNLRLSPYIINNLIDINKEILPQLMALDKNAVIIYNDLLMIARDELLKAASDEGIDIEDGNYSYTIDSDFNIHISGKTDVGDKGIVDMQKLIKDILSKKTTSGEIILTRLAQALGVDENSLLQLIESNSLRIDPNNRFVGLKLNALVNIISDDNIKTFINNLMNNNSNNCIS